MPRYLACRDCEGKLRCRCSNCRTLGCRMDEGCYHEATEKCAEHRPHTVLTDIFEFLFRWVEVYYSAQQYGGPEEGGWWYDCFTLERSYLIPRPFDKLLVLLLRVEARRKNNELRECYATKYDYVSVGSLRQRGEWATRRRPTYQ